MPDFEHSLPMLLLRARESCMAHFRPILSDHGLTEQQWRVIRALAEDDNLETKVLAEHTLILKPSMTGIIDRLARDGLVIRKKDSKDGRKTCIRLTRKARCLYARIMPEVDGGYHAMRKRLSESKWGELYSVLDHLIQRNSNSDKRQ